MVTDDERREAARRLRYVAEHGAPEWETSACCIAECIGEDDYPLWGGSEPVFSKLADLIEPPSKPDAEYEAWYNGLSHARDVQTIRELIEEIVWTTLTIDLGPNGNTDPSTGIDDGSVQTDSLFKWWERDLLRLSGAIDRDALLELADSMDDEADAADDAARSALLPGGGPMGERAARRHRGATADREARDACGWRAAALIVREACGEEGR